MYFVNRLYINITILLILYNFIILKAQRTHGERQSVFQILKERRLSLTLPFSSSDLNSYFTDVNGCASYCLASSSCKSANFRISTGECSLFGINSWEIEFNILSDIDNIFIQIMGETFVTHGEWTLVFRGTAHVSKSVYDAYIDTSLGYDLPLSPMYPIGCLRLDTNMSCDHHFRSNLLNNWSKLAITEVKFGIYKDGVMEKFLLFNGSSTTFMDWFSSAHLINSSWTDLTTSSIAYFSVMGSYGPEWERRFYVEYSHGGCNGDNGWFVCIDQDVDFCTWGMPGTSFPRLFYSQETTRLSNAYMKSADIIAIFIKF